MKRTAYVRSTPHRLPPRQAPEPGSLDAQLDRARRLVLSDVWSPSVKAAAVAGAIAYETGYPLSPTPHPAESVEAAAWLLGWWMRRREEA